MQILKRKKFNNDFSLILRFIALDSKNRAKTFKSEIVNAVNNLVYMPYKCRQSIYFEDESIRDLIYKGYTIVYKIDELKDTIIVIGMKKYQNEL